MPLPATGRISPWARQLCRALPRGPAGLPTGHEPIVGQPILEILSAAVKTVRGSHGHRDEPPPRSTIFRHRSQLLLERDAGLSQFTAPFLARMKFVDEQGEGASPTLSALRARHREHRAAGSRGVPPDALPTAGHLPSTTHEGATEDHSGRADEAAHAESGCRCSRSRARSRSDRKARCSLCCRSRRSARCGPPCPASSRPQGRPVGRDEVDGHANLTCRIGS